MGIMQINKSNRTRTTQAAQSRWKKALIPIIPLHSNTSADAQEQNQGHACAGLFWGQRKSIKNEILPTTARLNIFLLLSHPFLFLLLFSYSFFTIIPFVYIYGSDSARKMKNVLLCYGAANWTAAAEIISKLDASSQFPSYWCPPLKADNPTNSA